MSVGSQNITASFPGDSVYDQGSDSLSQTVDQAPTLTVITSPSPGSSVMYGNEGQNSLNFTVSAPNVSNNSPSGSVDVYDGVPGPDTYLCTGYLGGSGAGQSGGNCYINNAQMNAGLYSLTAIYNGDNNFAALSLFSPPGSLRRASHQPDAALPRAGIRLLWRGERQLLHHRCGGRQWWEPHRILQRHGKRCEPRRPRILFGRKRRGESLLSRLGNGPARLPDALCRDGELPGRRQLHRSIRDSPSHRLSGHDVNGPVAGVVHRSVRQ